jgi:hypothetical protein
LGNCIEILLTGQPTTSVSLLILERLRANINLEALSANPDTDSFDSAMVLPRFPGTLWDEKALTELVSLEGFGESEEALTEILSDTRCGWH